MAPNLLIVLSFLCIIRSSSGIGISELTDEDAANRVFVNTMFKKRIPAKKVKRNIVLSPVGVYFAASMAVQLIDLKTYKSWSVVTSTFKFKQTQNIFENQPQITSQSLIAGERWSKIVGSKVPKFSMPNYKLFDTVDVIEMEKFMKVNLSELNGALDAIVHKLTFAAEWETPFERYKNVDFSDGNTYKFMQSTINHASSFDSPQLRMITIPFKSLNKKRKIVIDFIVPQRESNYINLAHHGTWVKNSVTSKQTIVTIPKVKINYKTPLTLFRDKDIDALQRVKVEWDEKGATGEAVTAIFSRSIIRPSYFVIDRPFYFVIRMGNLWLFTGYVSKIDKDFN